MAPSDPYDPAGPGERFKAPTEGFGSDEEAPAEFTFDPSVEERVLDEQGVPSVLRDARQAISDVLRQQGGERQRIHAVDDLSDVTNILGVAIGPATAADLTAGRAAGTPGRPAVRVYLAAERSPEQLRTLLVDELGVDSLRSREYDVIPVVSGIIEAQSATDEHRPAPGGTSLGHTDHNGSGTLGCLVTGRTPPRSERVMILSNNHVMAMSNQANLGDCICQPGPADGGTCPDEQVAVLERYLPVFFGEGAVNFVDGATAWAYPDRVRREMLYMGPAGPEFFHVGRESALPSPNMPLGKSGATTGLTSGYQLDYPVATWVNYHGQWAWFVGLITIASDGAPFSAEGDSGSLVFKWDPNLQPVGLLFGGTAPGGSGPDYSVATPIDIVLTALDCNML
jgi:hypothetical protein